MKKFLFGLSLFLLVSTFFHKAILGFGIRLCLEQNLKCSLAYRSLEWEEGDLVFSDVVVFDPSFHVHVEKAYLHIDWKQLPKKLAAHLTIDRPRLSFLKIRSWPVEKSSFLDLTMSVNDGIVEWNGLARFSYDQNHLSVDWDDSGLDLFFDEGEIEAEFKQFHAQLLNPFLSSGEILGGSITGRVCLAPDQTLSSANLKLERGAVVASLGSVEGTTAAFSYNADLGAKWELKGIGRVNEKMVPFSCEGRGFFKSRWIESEIRFEEANARISGEKVWAFECQKIHATQATLLQAGASLFYPSLADIKFLDGTFNAKGSFSPENWGLEFDGTDLLFVKEKTEVRCEKAIGKLSCDGGEVTVTGKDYHLTASGTLEEWQMQLNAMSGNFLIKGSYDGEKVPLTIAQAHVGPFDFNGRGWIDSQFGFRLSFGGHLNWEGRKLPFLCSDFSRVENGFAFDVRLERQTWDLTRLKGIYNGKEFLFSEQSHLLSAPIRFGACSLSTCSFSTQIPKESFQAIIPLIKEWGLNLSSLPSLSTTDLQFEYKENKAKIFAQNPEMTLLAEEKEKDWAIELKSDIALKAKWQKDGLLKGKCQWQRSEAEFQGKVAPDFHTELFLSKISLNLSHIPSYQLEGMAKGEGHITYNGKWEADLDLALSALKLQNIPLENEGKVHLNYSSDKGILLGGVKVHGPLDCEVELLQYDSLREHWIFHEAHIHMPNSLLPKQALQFLDPKKELDFTADLDFAADLSSFACTMRQASIPFDGNMYTIEDVQAYWQPDLCKATCRYLKERVAITLNTRDQIAGKLTLGEEETPLSIDFDYGKELSIHSVEGSFSGLEATFHADSLKTLIGSARIDFSLISRFLPSKLVEVFSDLKMGKGYELKGQILFENDLPAFKGILSGKQLELFGCQFRTLLAQVTLSSSLVHIYDLKISDTAGMMKVDEILIEDKSPWTIAIPNLSIHEFRPSLMQKVGGPPGTISPLVVRELNLTNFKGLLDESITYTAEGNLHFINSYKREETIFDRPANVLNRIVGLDLELLIPVCGHLTFDLKDGAFHLLELTDAFSEANRSQFFLEMDPAPQVTLDGDMRIFIKMKQFVLLKITESFLISVDGKLDDPKYHLQRRRFFGLVNENPL